MTTVVVAGSLANKVGNGGEAWVRLSWVLGLARLGFDVVFLEEISSATCVDSRGQPAPFRQSANLSWFVQVTTRFGLVEGSALVLDGGSDVHGLTREQLLGRLDGAALLVNISGHVRTPLLLSRPGRRAYVDIDPGFTQMWHASGDLGAQLETHDVHFTIGENIGTPSCSIPTGGLTWIPTRQPVVLDYWPSCPSPGLERFTTVASWRGGYGPVTCNGTTFGLKVHEFRRIIDLPSSAAQTFEVALDIHPADAVDRIRLVQNGWRVTDPAAAAGEPLRFRRYVQGSDAELSPAQGVYVQTSSGWFSDRTTRYLASGKPALVQDTGFGRNLPVGDGLLSFTTLDEALTGVAAMADNYAHHATAARQVAEEHFASERVLAAFCDRAGVAP